MSSCGSRFVRHHTPTHRVCQLCRCIPWFFQSKGVKVRQTKVLSLLQGVIGYLKGAISTIKKCLFVPSKGWKNAVCVPPLSRAAHNTRSLRAQQGSYVTSVHTHSNTGLTSVALLLKLSFSSLSVAATPLGRFPQHILEAHTYTRSRCKP